MLSDDDILKAVSDPQFIVPDIIGAVEGWRAWKVDRTLPSFGLPPKLRSVTYGDYVWAPHRDMRADCPNECGDTPGERCSCGFYSAKTYTHLQDLGYHNYTGSSYYDDEQVCVVGRVANYGKVIECQQGWRSEWAYPVEFYLPHEAWRLAAPISAAYGVPCRLRNVLSRVLDDEARDAH